MRFQPDDRDILQTLVFDPTAEPAFELMKSCLVWPDERPVRISKDGYELLGDLWAIRGYLHRSVPSEQWGLDPAYFREVWTNALRDIPDWPGFKRLDLSDEARAYLARCLEEASTNRDY
jgi:hypothetical protein